MIIMTTLIVEINMIIIITLTLFVIKIDISMKIDIYFSRIKFNIKYKKPV